MAPNEVENPIINSPFVEPRCHWQIEKETLPMKVAGRSPASYFYRVPDSAARGRKRAVQLSLLGDTDIGQKEELDLVNRIRGLLAPWRAAAYPGTTGVTRELLQLWRAGGEQRAQRLFFAQIEAAETIIFLVEGPDTFKKGMGPIPKDEPGAAARAAGNRAFTRYACKMATGTGKTTVMGMLAAWSILNRVAEPTDDRFSDTVLIVCPNVTIRERLKELDPALGDLSLYRTRQLVPPQHMEALRRGEVMIANWHRLAKKEANTVNGDSARVVKTGAATQVIKHAGKSNETVETRFFESDRAWLKRIRQELGSGRGRCPHWLVFNDEAHHAYRRGEGADIQSLDETEDEDRGALAKKNAREATIWIEGLDRIHKLVAGSRKRGIRLCVDLSATPFFIQGSGNEVGKPLPWVVSDFGLLEETAKVFGVPFELVPFKVSKTRPDQPPPPSPKHIYAVPEKARFERDICAVAFLAGAAGRDRLQAGLRRRISARVRAKSGRRSTQMRRVLNNHAPWTAAPAGDAPAA